MMHSYLTEDLQQQKVTVAHKTFSNSHKMRLLHEPHRSSVLVVLAAEGALEAMRDALFSCAPPLWVTQALLYLYLNVTLLAIN
jgi:hypothetical protein